MAKRMDPIQTGRQLEVARSMEGVGRVQRRPRSADQTKGGRYETQRMHMSEWGGKMRAHNFRLGGHSPL